MKKTQVIIVGLCLLTSWAGADTNGLSLTLHFPYTEMLVDEWFDYSITLSNQSDSAILIIKDPRSMIPCQMIFDLGTKKEYRGSHYSFDAGWNKRRAFERSRRNAVPLPPGESYTWEVLYGYSDLHGAIEEYGVTNMSVRCLLGTNQWVRSNTVALSFYPDDDKTVMFDPPNGNNLQRNKGIDFKLYKIKLGEKFYLFNSLRQRICELPDGDHPVIRCDTEDDKISISFPRSKRIFLYNQKTPEVTEVKNGK